MRFFIFMPKEIYNEYLLIRQVRQCRATVIFALGYTAKYLGKQLTIRGVTRALIEGEVHIHIFVFCPTYLFQNQLLLRLI